jgi:hypothetical protein
MGLKVGDKIKIYQDGKCGREIEATIVKKIGRYYWLRYREYLADDGDSEVTFKYYKKGVELQKLRDFDGSFYRQDIVCRMHKVKSKGFFDWCCAYRKVKFDDIDKWAMRKEMKESVNLRRKNEIRGFLND